MGAVVAAGVDRVGMGVATAVGEGVPAGMLGENVAAAVGEGEPATRLGVAVGTGA